MKLGVQLVKLDFTKSEPFRKCLNNLDLRSGHNSDLSAMLQEAMSELRDLIQGRGLKLHFRAQMHQGLRQVGEAGRSLTSEIHGFHAQKNGSSRKDLRTDGLDPQNRHGTKMDNVKFCLKCLECNVDIIYDSFPPADSVLEYHLYNFVLRMGHTISLNFCQSLVAIRQFCQVNLSLDILDSKTHVPHEEPQRVKIPKRRGMPGSSSNGAVLPWHWGW